MPIAKARLDRMISMIDDAWLKRRDSMDRDTDPKQFLETASMRRNLPIAEPAQMTQEDEAPRRRNLFKYGEKLCPMPQPNEIIKSKPRCATKKKLSSTATEGPAKRHVLHGKLLSLTGKRIILIQPVAKDPKCRN